MWSGSERLNHRLDLVIAGRRARGDRAFDPHGDNRLLGVSPLEIRVIRI